jgi:hypothetical protein
MRRNQEANASVGREFSPTTVQFVNDGLSLPVLPGHPAAG